jgi:hypothetical protein
LTILLYENDVTKCKLLKGNVGGADKSITDENMRLYADNEWIRGKLVSVLLSSL